MSSERTARSSVWSWVTWMNAKCALSGGEGRMSIRSGLPVLGLRSSRT